jgi:hypothetical protein
MSPADDVEAAAKKSPLWSRYGTRADAQSAREILASRVETPAPAPADPEPTPKPEKKHKEAADAAGGGAGAIGKFLKSRQGKALERQVVRGVFGMLKKRL